MSDDLGARTERAIAAIAGPIVSSDDARERAATWIASLEPWGIGGALDLDASATPASAGDLRQTFASVMSPIASALGRASSPELDAAFAEGARLAYDAANTRGYGFDVWPMVEAAADLTAYAKRWRKAASLGLVVAGYRSTPPAPALDAFETPWADLPSPYEAALALIATGHWLVDSEDGRFTVAPRPGG